MALYKLQLKRYKRKTFHLKRFLNKNNSQSKEITAELGCLQSASKSRIRSKLCIGLILCIIRKEPNKEVIQLE